jgi:hypothetical protein
VTRFAVRLAVVLITIAGTASPTRALAQGIAPWRPLPVDSARVWANEGLALLAGTTSDSLGPTEAAAYDRFDRIARRHFEALGPGRMSGARGVIARLDSLGIAAEFAQDENLPQFCALTFFHPRFAGYVAVTYLYWFRSNELMRQRLLLTGGKNLQMAVWWTGNPLGPYELGLLDRRRNGDTRETFFTMLRISRLADFWGVIQWGRKDVDLGGRGPARFIDINEDATPEIVNWVESVPDPRFVVDPHLPQILSERLWQRTDTGFVLFDRRTMPTPFATWVLFLRALTAGETATTRALVATPAVLARARTLGLGAVHADQSWQVLESPAIDRWNQRMSFLYGAPQRNRGLDVRMKFHDGHWAIESIESRAINPAAPVPPALGTGGAPR